MLLLKVIKKWYVLKKRSDRSTIPRGGWSHKKMSPRIVNAGIIS